MGEESRLRDIKQRTFDFALEIIKLCGALDARSGVSRTLAHQLLRSGTSVGANVEEAQAGQSHADFINKYSIALKEARETIYWLRLLEASGYCSDGESKLLLQEGDEIARIIGSIVVKAKKIGKQK